MAHMYGPAVRRKRVSSICRLFGLASMYPASDWSVCSGPPWISARLRSHYRPGLKWAIWVTSFRMRREDRSSKRPSCLISCTQSGPTGGLTARVGMQGATKPWRVTMPSITGSSGLLELSECRGIATGATRMLEVSEHGIPAWPPAQSRGVGLIRQQLEGMGDVTAVDPEVRAIVEPN
jgi:hypothetical protein